MDALASIPLAESDDHSCESPHFGEGCPCRIYRFLTQTPLGSTSNISLIQQITSQLSINENAQLLTRMAEANEGRPPARTPSDLGQASIHIPGPNSNTEVDPYSLPSTATTDQLIHVYFSTVHLFLPCLDERAFLRKYHACQKGVKRSTTTVSGAWLGSFYIVLSLACQCLEAKSPESNRVAESEIYYRKAVNAGMKQAIYGMGFELGECF